MPEPTTIVTPTNNTLKLALEEHHKQQKILLTEEDSPHIFIVGPSGSGKSRSLMNLPPEHTLIFNPEGKPLPFQDPQNKWKERKLSGFKNTGQIRNIFKAAVQDSSIRYIAFDSLTEYLELMKQEILDGGAKGYEIYNQYASGVQSFLLEVRRVKSKIIILTSLDEQTKEELDSGSLKTRRFASCEGKMFTKLESKFSITLFTSTKTKPGSNPPQLEYQFATNGDGITSAKSPEGMFPFYIPNDLNYVVKEVEKYFGIKYL
jgi:hypothetical protein